MGDRAKDQVINLFNLWLSIRQTDDSAPTGLPRILWCYKDDLGFSSHQKKRKKEINKQVKQGLYEAETENPFELFLNSSDIRYCYYKDTQSILGNTFEILVLQDFEGITANILCRTIETIAGGGVVFLMLKSMTTLKQLYSMAMDVHSRYRTDAFSEVQPLFNERLMLSLASSEGVLFMDDELNLLNLSSIQQKSVVAINEEDDEEVEDPVVKSIRVASKNHIDLIESLKTNKIIHSILKLTKTIDQAKVVLFLLDSIANKNTKSANLLSRGLQNAAEKHETVFLSAGRGRGKSAALGLSIAGALAYNCGNICITAATPENLKTVFEFLSIGLEALGHKKNLDFMVAMDADNNPKQLTFYFAAEVNGASENANGVQGGKSMRIVKQLVTYVSPDSKNLNCSLLVIDEAAAIPVTSVKPLIMSNNCPVLISSTVHGYEGTGRSLSIKLIDEIRKQGSGNSGRYLREIEMIIPIRYGIQDPIENWLNSFLCLDSTTPVPLKNTLPHPKDCKLYFVQKTTLFSYNKSSEKFLKSLWSLFVSSHYKNSPNDLQLLADAPAHTLAVLLGPIDSSNKKGEIPDILVAIQLAFEGGIKSSTVEHNRGRGIRPSGDLVPWTLAEQFLDQDIFNIMGARIVRIATHPGATKLGYGSKALELLEKFFKGEAIGKEDTLPFERFSAAFDSSQQNAQGAGPNSIESSLVPKKHLPPLLKPIEDLSPPDMSYLSVSFGLTKELFRFWNKNSFQTVYVRQSKNDVTGEHTAIMIRGLNHDSLNFDFFFREFKKRFTSLLGSDFCALDMLMALHMLQPNLTTSTSDSDEHSNEKSDSRVFEVLFSEFDLARLEAYSKNAVEHFMIKDLLPKISELFFLNKFAKDVKLSLSQAAILIGFGLQRKSLEEISEVMRLDYSQVLALYNKMIKRLTKNIKEAIESSTAKAIGFSEKPNANIPELAPVKLDSENLMGTIVQKRKMAPGQSAGFSGEHRNGDGAKNKKVKHG
jgi:N-acetyltransferase 10